MLALFSWPESAGASIVPEQPVWSTPGCTWALPPSSWKTPTLTVTRLQSIVPSSGSVTVTVYGISSPQSKMPPWIGHGQRRPSGRVLPAVMTTVEVPDLPVESVAVRRTL